MPASARGIARSASGRSRPSRARRSSARIEQLPAGTKFSVLAPLIRQQKGEYKDLFEDLLKQGFVRARVDGEIVQLTDNLSLDRQMRHDIEVVVDRLVDEGETSGRGWPRRWSWRCGWGRESDCRDWTRRASSVQPPDGVVRLKKQTDETAEAADARQAKRHKRGRGAPGDMLVLVRLRLHHCGLSFEPPSPQLFSFNSPQGMCPECDGLGVQYSFDPDLLAPFPKLSFKEGCFELIGPWHDLGRWRRHIYQGVADTMERKRGLEAGTMLETPWEKLAPELQKLWLYGTGERAHHVHLASRQQADDVRRQVRGDRARSADGRYRDSKSKTQIRQLEKYMRMVRCPECHGERLMPQARAVRIDQDQQSAQSSGQRAKPSNARCPDAAAGLRLAGQRSGAVLPGAGARRRRSSRSPRKCSRKFARGWGFWSMWGWNI